MEHERKVSLPGLQLGFSSDGAVAAAALPSSMRTVASLPEATLMDGTAQALRLGRLAGSRTRCVLMSRGLPMFGAGGLSDAGLRALRHEMLRRLELPADALAFLLQGTRRELVPVGPLADRCVQAWRRLSAGALLPDGWTGLEVPVMTPEGLMRAGALASGGAAPTENRVVLLSTDVSVRPELLQVIADRAAQPLFSWLRAAGVLSAADAVMIASPSVGRPVSSMTDAGADMLVKAVELTLGKISRTWAAELGKTVCVRIEGVRDEIETDRLVSAFMGAGVWLRAARSPREASLVLRAALERSALAGLDASGFALRCGDDADALTHLSDQTLADLQKGRATIVLSMARGNWSTTFCV